MQARGFFFVKINFFAKQIVHNWVFGWVGELNWFEKNERFGLLDKDFRVHLKETSENQILFISFILYFFN